MSIHASEQVIVDTLSAFIPMDVIKYEIIPRYRLPTPEEIEKGKRMFNRCLVELEFNETVYQKFRRRLTTLQAKIRYSNTTEFAMIQSGLSEEILQTLKPSEVKAFIEVTDKVDVYRWCVIERIKWRFEDDSDNDD